MGFFESADTFFVIIAILLAGLFIALTVALTRGKSAAMQRVLETAGNTERRTATLEQGLTTVYAAQGELGGRLGQLSEVLTNSHGHLAQLLEERLEAVNMRVGQSLTEQSEKTGQSLTELQSRLAAIDAAQKNITELSGQVVGLQDILANKNARGAFGEVQLTDLISKALPPSMFKLQVTLGNNRRADCLVDLPNPPGPIVIDAKFPLEPFHALRNAQNESELKAARKAFSDAVLRHIKDIKEKYIVAGQTADSALMFIPSEAVYAELHASFADVVDRSYRDRVWIVSPTTLMATLNTVRAVVKDARMREQADVIQKEVRLLLEDVRRLGERTKNLQSHFKNTSKDVEEIIISAGKITKHAELIDDLQVSTPQEIEAALQNTATGGAGGSSKAQATSAKTSGTAGAGSTGRLTPTSLRRSGQPASNGTARANGKPTTPAGAGQPEQRPQ